MLIIWRMISIAKKLFGKHDQEFEIFGSDKYTLEQRLDAQKKYGCANVEFGGNGKTRSIAIVSNKYNEEDRNDQRQ
jgi:hypothetical protein